MDFVTVYIYSFNLFRLIIFLFIYENWDVTEEAAQSGRTDTVINPSFPIRRHVKWKIARTKKTGQMTSEATKEIADKIVSDFQLLIAIIYVYCVIE